MTEDVSSDRVLSGFHHIFTYIMCSDLQILRVWGTANYCMSLGDHCNSAWSNL